MSKADAYLTPEQKREVCRRSDIKGLLYLVHCWGIIFGAMALFALWPNPLTFILGVMAIGARQLGLAILMHDGAHGILTKSPKLNAFVSQWLCAFPTFTDTWAYRHYHLHHHRRTQQPDDPDLGLSAAFPITKDSFRRKVIRDLTGQTAFKQRKAQIKGSIGKRGQPLPERWAIFKQKLGRQVLCNLVLLGGLAAIGQWHLYFVMWLLPFATWYQLITRVRNIGEHAMVPAYADIGLNARTTYTNVFTGLFLAPYNVNYHAEHHMMMYIPCYNLPKAHEYLRQNGWHKEMTIESNYGSVLKRVTSKPDMVAHAA